MTNRTSIDVLKDLLRESSNSPISLKGGFVDSVIPADDLLRALTNYPLVRVTSSLNIRTEPSINSRIIQTLKFDTVVPVTGEEHGGFLKLANRDGWIFKTYTKALQPVETPVKVVNVSEVTPAPFPPAPATEPDVVAPPYVLPPKWKLPGVFRGVHASAGGWAPDDRQLDLIRKNQIDTVFIVAYEPGQAQYAIPRFRSAGVRNFIIRAAIHEPITTPERFITITTPILTEYVRHIGSTIDMMIQVHNEPNIKQEGMWSAWRNGSEFASWWQTVATAYSLKLPGCKLGFPATSPGGSVPDLRYAESSFIRESMSAINAADWIAVHAYWVNPDGSDLDINRARLINLYNGDRFFIGTEIGPADATYVTAMGVRTGYTRCQISSIPAMMWLLEGAGAFPNADWTKNQIYL